MLLSQYVHQRRQELNLSQKQIAKSANISVDTVQRFESEGSYNPHGITLLRLCKALQISLDDAIEMIL
ncbi:helix-turn-helix domain-containing protein [Paenibacillus dokdonensis]|uniref:helix-turn-helix domain-containing protein n=1 Tax=Paenibacillus dokdonensis TaxID=2567944 RepID=UPI0010A859B3